MAVALNTGFEFGTLAGFTTGNAADRLAESLEDTASWAMSTTTPRNGSYSLRWSPTGAFSRMIWTGNQGVTTTSHTVNRFAIRPVSGSGTLGITGADDAAGNYIQLAYNFSTNQFQAVHWTSGHVQTGTVRTSQVCAVGEWHLIEWYTNRSANPWICKWRVNNVDQTDASGAFTAADADFLWLGTRSSQLGTAVFDFDDLAVSNTAADYPLGNGKSVLLSVDPAGTVTLSGTSGNFQTFTSNGTLAAWNATTARNNIDEIPPTISASADGFVQINLAATDYVEIPMTSYTLTSGESVSAARMLAPIWATSATAATIGIRSYNGTTETTLYAAADPNSDNSTTAPAWVAKMLTLADINTQGELDALAFRVGFSGDATPDIGIHAIYAEVDIKITAATVTPAVLACTTALPAAGVGVGVTKAPVAAVTALPASALSVGATVAPVASVAALPQAAVSVAAAPAVLAATTALPAATASSGVTPTPAVIAAVTTLPQASILSDLFVTPAVIAAVTTLPQPAVSIATAPAVLAATTALPAAGVGVGATASPIAAVASLPQPTLLYDFAVSPAVIQAVATLPAATVLYDFVVTPAVIAAVTALPPAAVSVGASPAAIAALASLAQSAVSIAAAPAVVASVAALPAPAVGVGVTKAPIAAVTTLPLASAGQDAAGAATVTPTTLQAVVALAQSAVSVAATPAAVAAVTALAQSGVGVGATPAVLAATTALPAPAVSSAAAPATITATTALPPAAVGVGVTPAVLAAVVALAQASVTLGITVTPATIAAVATLFQPAVSVGVAPAVIQVLVALLAPNQAGEARPNINAGRSLLVGAVIVAADALAGATATRGGLVGAVIVESDTLAGTTTIRGGMIGGVS